VISAGHYQDGYEDDSYEKTIAAQLRLRNRWRTGRVVETGCIRLVAGLDAAYSCGMTSAAAVSLTFPGSVVAEAAFAREETRFPYIPGLLAFREGPALARAFRSLHTRPDMILVNGHGIAHPRRFGMACQIGAILDIPSVGVARRLLTGTADLPGPFRGACSPVRDGAEIIGMSVRTRTGVHPVYISVGHRTDLDQAVEVVLATTGRYRVPEPLRKAHEEAKYRSRLVAEG
jgi:deoxyribonuclease V